MADIRIRIVVELVSPSGHVTLDLKQAHRTNGGRLRDEVDQALADGIDQVRGMYRASRRAATRPARVGGA